MIHEFYAVTQTSIYKVSDQREDGYPEIVKIALKGKSKMPVGHKLSGGPMVAICKFLILYIPEGGGITSFERRIENVNTRYWGGNTSFIVALFKDEEGARKCFEFDDQTAMRSALAEKH